MVIIAPHGINIIDQELQNRNDFVRFLFGCKLTKAYAVSDDSK